MSKKRFRILGGVMGSNALLDVIRMINEQKDLSEVSLSVDLPEPAIRNMIQDFVDTCRSFLGDSKATSEDTIAKLRVEVQELKSELLIVKKLSALIIQAEN